MVASADDGPQTPEPPAPRRRDRVAVAAFLILFLIPMFARSTVLRRPLPGAPELLTKLHSIACLFTHKPNAWGSYYVQIRYPERPTWETLDQHELFPLQPFGRRTRMHRLLVAWQAKPSPKTEDMARWIVERHTFLHPEAPRPEAIRFTRAWMIPSRDEPPEHGWRHPTWLEVPPKRRRVIAVYLVDDLERGPE